MKRSIYVLVVEDQKSINDMHDYTLKSTYLYVYHCFYDQYVESRISLVYS